MLEFLMFWGAKELVGIGTLLVVLVAVILFHVPGWVRVARCKHEKYFENGQCDAICRHCGKNLGFIGTVRRSRATKPE